MNVDDVSVASRQRQRRQAVRTSCISTSTTSASASSAAMAAGSCAAPTPPGWTNSAAKGSNAQLRAEPQCTPTRSALMTGRYPIRSGNGTVICRATQRFRRLGADDGRHPVRGRLRNGQLRQVAHRRRSRPLAHRPRLRRVVRRPARYDECLWPDDPLYDPNRDPMSFVVAATKGGALEDLEANDHWSGGETSNREDLMRSYVFIRAERSAAEHRRDVDLLSFDAAPANCAS